MASTFGYQQAVQDIAEVEEILGNIAEAASYRALSDGIKQGFNDMWFNTTDLHTTAPIARAAMRLRWTWALLLMSISQMC